MPQPLVWQRRPMPSQQAIIGPAPIEGVEKMNVVVVRDTEQRSGQGTGVSPRQDSYVMEVDKGRNCYACRGLGHMAHHCRNWGQREKVAEGRRLKYGKGRIEEINEHFDNLKGVENLESLD